MQISLQAPEISILHSVIALYFGLCLGEYEYFQVSIRCDEPFDERLFGLKVFAEYDLVADGVGHLNAILAHQVQHDRLPHVLLSNVLNILRHCCGENHGLGTWHELLNPHNVLVEAHVEHFVSFV